MTNSLLACISFSLLGISFSLNSISKSLKYEKLNKQERNDAIVFCVENPTNCKTEYLKLK